MPEADVVFPNDANEFMTNVLFVHFISFVVGEVVGLLKENTSEAGFAATERG